MKGPKWGVDIIATVRKPGDLWCGPLHLVEVKTSRPGKEKRGMTSNMRRASRRAWRPEDLEKLKALGMKFLLVNVQFLHDWQFEVSEREL